MSFQVYLPICRLEQFLSLILFLFHIYFKCSSFCLYHSSLPSLSLLFFVRQQKSPSSHLQNSLHTICPGWQALALSSPFSPGGSWLGKSWRSPFKAAIGRVAFLLVPLLWWTFISPNRKQKVGYRNAM